jgi:hypothetical protein
MYVPGGTGGTLQNITLTKLQWRFNHVVRFSDGKVQIKLVYLYSVISCIVT